MTEDDDLLEFIGWVKDDVFLVRSKSPVLTARYLEGLTYLTLLNGKSYYCQVSTKDCNGWDVMRMVTND